MTDTIEITRFTSGRRGYNKADSESVACDAEDEFAAIAQFLRDAVSQLRNGHGAPSGISFAGWRGTRCINHDSNIRSVGALALDYEASRIDELAKAAARLGWARIWIESENRARTVNAVTLVIPFTAPLTINQYSRVAACIATELDVYGLLDGALAASHIVNVHATSFVAAEAGELLDGEAYIARTARDFRGLDARKYERSGPAAAAAVPIQAGSRPVITDDAGLFEWPATEADMAVMRAARLIGGAPSDITSADSATVFFARSGFAFSPGRARQAVCICR